jgi:hypothetical protein
MDTWELIVALGSIIILIGRRWFKLTINVGWWSSYYEHYFAQFSTNIQIGGDGVLCKVLGEVVKYNMVFYFSILRIQWWPLDSKLLNVQVDIVQDRQPTKAIDCKERHKVLFCNPYGGLGHLCDLQVVTSLELIDL